MRVGVFSDDSAGMAVALLVGRGLASIGERVEVLASRGAPLNDGDVPGLRIARLCGDEVANAEMKSAKCDGHLVLVLPLDALGTGLPSLALDVVLSVGLDRPASARALRAARYAAGAYQTPILDEASRPVPPAWFVPCSHQADLWTKATLASTGAVSLPFATRAVPFMVPRLTPEWITDLIRLEAPQPVLRTAVFLASVVTAISADPSARGIDAASVAVLMTGKANGTVLGVGDRLLALAAEYERLDVPVAREGGQRCPPPNGRRYPCKPYPKAFPPRRYAAAARGRAAFVARKPLVG